MKRILVVAGSDSSGGAGLEADQKVIAIHGCYAMTATTALTAQNTLGVNNIHITPTDFVRQQIDACVEDIGVDVVKTGMLASASTISMVATALRTHNISMSVVDPVMVATTGAQLLPDTAVKALCDDLLPCTFLLTPNIPEANLLLEEAGRTPVDVQNVDDLKQLAEAVNELGPKHVLIKGGHVPMPSSVDKSRDQETKVIANILFGQGVSEVIECPYRESKNTHGTGCSLACNVLTKVTILPTTNKVLAAIACNLAKGHALNAAVRQACKYVDAGIQQGIDLGRGSGPINHFHSLQVLPFAPGCFVEYVLDREDVKAAWHKFTHHEFVRQMGDGSLPTEAFKYYMIQDYLYLIHFARAHALAGYKSKSIDGVTRAAEIVVHIRQEINLHLRECEDFGLSQEQMEGYDESEACTAYSRYVLDIGHSEDWLALQVSLLPCLLGYHVIGKRLDEWQKLNKPKGANRYRTWIDNYIDEGYRAAVEKGCALVEKHAMVQSPKRIEELVKIFKHATKMETGFWNMAATS